MLDANMGRYLRFSSSLLQATNSANRATMINPDLICLIILCFYERPFLACIAYANNMPLGLNDWGWRLSVLSDYYGYFLQIYSYCFNLQRKTKVNFDKLALILKFNCIFWLAVFTEIGLKAFKTGVLTLMFGTTGTKK